MSKAPRVAIVHDWLVGGGAERVVHALHEIYPDAPIYTSYASDEWRKKLNNKVVAGWLQHLGPLRKYIPFLRIWWFTGLDLSEYDLVISSSGNGEAHGVKTSKHTVHICYCHTPTHFYWRHYNQYLNEPGFGFFNPLARLSLKMLAKPLRRWDKKAASRPDFYIANSEHIRRDIKRYYERSSVVIHPPINTKRFATKKHVKRSGFVTVGRQVPYKKVDLIIRACEELGVPLTVVGGGPEHQNLLKIAGPNTTFIEAATDADVNESMWSAQGFIFAAHEDFGITPVEALAAGTPVIAYKAGGALDYVKDGQNGVFFEEQTVESIMAALADFQQRSFDSKKVQKTAEAFSDANFKTAIQHYIKECL